MTDPYAPSWVERVEGLARRTMLFIGNMGQSKAAGLTLLAVEEAREGYVHLRRAVAGEEDKKSLADNYLNLIDTNIRKLTELPQEIENYVEVALRDPDIGESVALIGVTQNQITPFIREGKDYTEQFIRNLQEQGETETSRVKVLEAAQQSFRKAELANNEANKLASRTYVEEGRGL